MAGTLPPVRGLSFGQKVVVAPIINTNLSLLSPLTLDTNSFVVGSPQGTVIGTVQGTTPGSMLLLTNSDSGAVQLVSGVIQVGPNPASSVSAFTIELTEILAGAPPNATTMLIGAISSPVPLIITLPVISGSPQVGQTLAASTGTWANSPLSFAYQWNDTGTPIAGAISSSYSILSADISDLITVSVTAFNGVGASIPATSAATSAIIDIIPTIRVPPSIPGTPNVGFPITAIDAIWNNSVTSLVYQWKSAGVNATGAGANTLSYTPVTGDLGNTLTITVTATNSGGTGTPSTSAASAVVGNAGTAANSTTYIILMAA
jgi:hypothetical protein